MWNSRLAACARAHPLSVRCQVELEEQREVIRLLSLRPSASGWRGPACLLFHRHDERLENQHQLVIRGQLVEEDQMLLLLPSAFVTANGRREQDLRPSGERSWQSMTTTRQPGARGRPAMTTTRLAMLRITAQATAGAALASSWVGTSPGRWPSKK